MKQFYVVVQEQNDHPYFGDVLSKLHKGDVFSIPDIAGDKLGSKKYQHALKAINYALKNSLIQITDSQNLFKEFCKLDTVSYFGKQLKSTQYKNTAKKDDGTRGIYLRNLFHFNQWLIGKPFVYKTTAQIDVDTYRVTEQKTTLTSVQHFMELYASSKDSEAHFIKMIKSYLMDDTHAEKKFRTMESIRYAILGYFEKNDYPIKFKFDCSTEHEKSESMSSLDLNDVYQLLTKGKPSIMEHALVLCKFHRGLDNVTLADGFNYEAWGQLVKYFGTSEYQNWDLSLCPVPIALTRLKNQYLHTGFLDIDAIVSLQNWLKKRYEITGKAMTSGEPLFFTTNKTPVGAKYVYTIIHKLAKTAGINEKIGNYAKSVRYEKNSHELRDLLKSLVIDSSGRQDIADHIIGHKPKDSYEKQNELFPETLRDCYAMCRKKLNIFSNVSEYLKHGDSKQVKQLHMEIEQIRTTHKEEMNNLKDMILQRGMKQQLQLDSDIEQIIPKIIQKGDVNTHMQFIQNYIQNNRINDDILHRGDDSIKEQALQNRHRYNHAIQVLTEDMIKLASSV